LTAKYGPCVGISRLERWERAHKWGLNPPEEVSVAESSERGRSEVLLSFQCLLTVCQIKKILLTQQGEDNVDLRESILHGWV